METIIIMSFDVAGERAVIWLNQFSDELILKMYDELELDKIIHQIPLDSDTDEQETKCEAVVWHLRRHIVDGGSQP